MKQRPETGDDHLIPSERMWTPEGLAVGRQVMEVPLEDQLYAAVDDVAFGKVTIDIAPWPRLTHKGHLWFGEELPRIVVERERAERIVNARREELGQTTRPIRIGDAFRFTRADGSHPEREIAEDYYVEEDITEDARRAAKMALYGAVAHWLTPEEAERLPARAAAEQDASQAEAAEEESDSRDAGPGAYPSV